MVFLESSTSTDVRILGTRRHARTRRTWSSFPSHHHLCSALPIRGVHKCGGARVVSEVFAWPHQQSYPHYSFNHRSLPLDPAQPRMHARGALAQLHAAAVEGQKRIPRVAHVPRARHPPERVLRRAIRERRREDPAAPRAGAEHDEEERGAHREASNGDDDARNAATGNAKQSCGSSSSATAGGAAPAPARPRRRRRSPS